LLVVIFSLLRGNPSLLVFRDIELETSSSRRPFPPSFFLLKPSGARKTHSGKAPRELRLEEVITRRPRYDDRNFFFSLLGASLYLDLSLKQVDNPGRPKS